MIHPENEEDAEAQDLRGQPKSVGTHRDGGGKRTRRDAIN